jgi:hypothetical protein
MLQIGSNDLLPNPPLEGEERVGGVNSFGD